MKGPHPHPLDDTAADERAGTVQNAPKKPKAPDFYRRLAKHALLDGPRYINVPFPASCRCSAAGVGNQAVWGLHIITSISISTLTLFQESVNSKKWRAGKPAVVTAQSQLKRASLILIKARQGKTHPYRLRDLRGGSEPREHSRPNLVAQHKNAVGLIVWELRRSL